jgi:excisionase family DNA binding protein
MPLNQLGAGRDSDPTEARSHAGHSSTHPLITVGEAARMLGFSGMTIRRRIEARQFPAVKIGSKALVPRAFVEQLLQAALAGQTVVAEELAAEWSKPVAENAEPAGSLFAAARDSVARGHDERPWQQLCAVQWDRLGVAARCRAGRCGPRRGGVVSGLLRLVTVRRAGLA